MRRFEGVAMVEVLANQDRAAISERPRLREPLADRNSALASRGDAQVAHEDRVAGLDELLRLDGASRELGEPSAEGLDHTAVPHDPQAQNLGDRLPLELGVEADERGLEVVAVEGLISDQ
jgi:hypothetical protein